MLNRVARHAARWIARPARPDPSATRVGAGGAYTVGIRPGNTLIVPHRTPTCSAATGAAIERWMSQQQVNPTDRRDEVIHVAVKCRKDETPEQMREADKIPQPAAEDLRIPRIVSETPRRTDA